MGNVTVPVPDGREGEFFEMFGRWLQGSLELKEGSSGAISEWTDADGDLAREVWDRFTDRAKAVFGTLLDASERISGDELAERLDIPNGKYGVAGLLAWPGRHCAAVGRPLPVQYEDGPTGESARYWIPEAPAALFNRARKLGK